MPSANTSLTRQPVADLFAGRNVMPREHDAGNNGCGSHDKGRKTDGKKNPKKKKNRKSVDGGGGRSVTVQ